MDKLTTQRAIEMLGETLVPIREFLNNSNVQEVMVNGPDDVWVEERGILSKREIHLSEVNIRSAISIIARLSGKEASETTKDAIIDARMPGFRFAAALTPISTKGSSISIRKHAPIVRDLEDYVKDGSLPQEVFDILIQAVVGRKNFIVSGGTSTGKTTFLNAMAKKIPLHERVVSIEDTKELQILTPNYVSFESNEKQGISIRDLVKLALRYRPDRIVVGEVRGAEAFDLMQAMNTGHDGGFSTLHANSAKAALRRLESLVLTTPGVDWPIDAIRAEIGSTFNLVVHLSRDVNGRRCIKEVLEITDFDYERKSYVSNYLYQNKNAVH